MAGGEIDRARPRYVRRQMCNLDRPDDLAAWMLIDRTTGMPVCDAHGIRVFTRAEIDTELELLSQADK